MRVIVIMGLLVLGGFGLLAVGYAAEQASLRAEAVEARAASQMFAKTLKSQLIAAIKAGGPKSAIPVCQQIAPAVAKQYASDGLVIGRTSFRIRNPANAPDDWERDVLVGFAKAMEKGVDPKTLERFAFFPDKSGGKTFRYMKAIAVTQPCLACHGSNVSPAVQDALDKHYPDDQATGFALGDLRGAFTVRKVMPKS